MAMTALCPAPAVLALQWSPPATLAPARAHSAGSPLALLSPAALIPCRAGTARPNSAYPRTCSQLSCSPLPCSPLAGALVGEWQAGRAFPAVFYMTPAVLTPAVLNPGRAAPAVFTMTPAVPAPGHARPRHTVLTPDRACRRRARPWLSSPLQRSPRPRWRLHLPSLAPAVFTHGHAGPVLNPGSACPAVVAPSHACPQPRLPPAVLTLRAHPWLCCPLPRSPPPCPPPSCSASAMPFPTACILLQLPQPAFLVTPFGSHNRLQPLTPRPLSPPNVTPQLPPSALKPTGWPHASAGPSPSICSHPRVPPSHHALTHNGPSPRQKRSTPWPSPTGLAPLPDLSG